MTEKKAPIEFFDSESSLDDTLETRSIFMNKVYAAQRSGAGYVETTPEIMKEMNPDWEPGTYFLFHNPAVKVYAIGEKEMIDKKESVPLAQRLHGPNEGIIVGR